MCVEPTTNVFHTINKVGEHGEARYGSVHFASRFKNKCHYEHKTKFKWNFSLSSKKAAIKQWSSIMKYGHNLRSKWVTKTVSKLPGPGSLATVAGEPRYTTILCMGRVATVTQFSTNFAYFLDEENKSQVFRWSKTIKKRWMNTANKRIVSFGHVL